MKLKNNKGVTGVDVAVAVTIFIVFLSIITAMFSNIVTTSQEINRKAKATNLAIDVIEKIKRRSFDSVSTNMSAQELGVVVPDGYTIDISVEDYKNENILKTVSVNVGFKNRKTNENINLETLLRKGPVRKILIYSTAVKYEMQGTAQAIYEKLKTYYIDSKIDYTNQENTNSLDAMVSSDNYDLIILYAGAWSVDAAKSNNLAKTNNLFTIGNDNNQTLDIIQTSSTITLPRRS